jgi:integral membrane protein (TIGR01906 family)
MKIGEKKGLFYFGVVSLVAFVFLLSLFVFVYNPWFYDWQYRENGVYDALGQEEVLMATHNLWDFMLFRSNTLSDFFSEQDGQHMIDVRNILATLGYLLFFSFVSLLLVFVIRCRKKGFGTFIVEVFRRASYGIFVVVGFLALLAVFFDVSFLWFHKLFFFNDLWLMDPTVDMLVVLYPSEFFQFIFIFIIALSFIFGFLLFFLSQFLKKHI